VTSARFKERIVTGSELERVRGGGVSWVDAQRILKESTRDEY
jgi:hypothetical protein